MRRRDFLVSGACLTAATFLQRIVRGVELLFPEAPPGVDPVAVARGKDYTGMVRRAVHALGGIRLVARREERIVIKPSLAWHRRPGQGANVHPEVLRAVIELALEGGAASVILIERTSMRADAVYRISGAQQVVSTLKDPRVEFLMLRQSDFVPFKLNRGNRAEKGGRGEVLSGTEERARLEAAFAELGASLERFRVCRHLLQADRIINLAAARHHPTRKVSLGFSNLLGLISGWPMEPRWRWQQDAELALLGAAIRPELTIIDATHAIVSNGPAGRDARDVGRWDTIAASRDPLGAEAPVAKRFRLRAEDLPYLQIAAQLGLGKSETAGRLMEV